MVSLGCVWRKSALFVFIQQVWICRENENQKHHNMSNNKTKGGKNNEFHIPQSVIESEYEKQRDFYKRIGINPDLSHNTDGIYKGNLFEHKITISNIYKVLFQAIKYASRIRIRGERLPANIILTDLMGETAYLFKSQDLLQDIEKVYFGAASKDNDEYSTNVQGITIHYSNSTGLQKLLEFINCEEYVRYHIDKTNVVGLAQQFYKSCPNKVGLSKGMMLKLESQRFLQIEYILMKAKTTSNLRI